MSNRTAVKNIILKFETNLNILWSAILCNGKPHQCPPNMDLGTLTSLVLVRHNRKMDPDLKGFLEYA